MKNLQIRKTVVNQVLVSLTGFLLLLTGACRESIQNLRLDSTGPHLVVEGYISTDYKTQVVKLSRMGDALMSEPVQPVSNAAVSISDGSQTFELIEDTLIKGTYYTTSKLQGVPGKKYTLRVQDVDIDNDQAKEEYTAESLIKGINPIDSVHLVYNTSNPHFKGWSVNLFVMDPGKGRNYYLIKVLKNNRLLTDSIFKYSIGDNSGFEGKYYDGFPAYSLRESRQDERLTRGDTITVELYSITEDYYSFISAYIQDYYPKIPIFSGPAANIPGNIQPYNKAVGIFTAYSIERKSVVYR